RHDLYVAKAALREVRLQLRDRGVELHVGHETKVELRDGAMRLDRLTAGPGVARDEALDVHRRREEETLERLAPSEIVRPTLRVQEPPRGPFRAALRGRIAGPPR